MENLSEFKMTSYDWYEEYELKMGEQNLRDYVNKVWKGLLELKLGESLDVIENVQPERYDLFIKIGCLFIQENNMNYEFNNQYTKIRHRYDAQEMEKTLAFFREKRRQNDARRNGQGIESGFDGTETVSPPLSDISGD